MKNQKTNKKKSNTMKSIEINNQEIKKQLIRNEIYCDVTRFIEELSGNDEDLMNEIYFTENEETGQYYEPLACYAVTEYLSQCLKKQNELIIENYGHYIWCREQTGQPVYMDSCIDSIANDMQILVGQVNEWKL